MSTVLKTTRLTLTPVAVSDFGDLCALWADETFARAVMPAALSPEEVWLRLLRDVGHWQALGYGNWAVRLTETGAFAGTIGVFEFKRVLTPVLDAPELGWGVVPALQRQGIALEGLEAALQWCDGRDGLQRTVCIIDPANAPSLALAARVGYRPRVNTLYRGKPIMVLERAGPSRTDRDRSYRHSPGSPAEGLEIIP